MLTLRFIDHGSGEETLVELDRREECWRGSTSISYKAHSATYGPVVLKRAYGEHEELAPVPGGTRLYSNTTYTQITSNPIWDESRTSHFHSEPITAKTAQALLANEAARIDATAGAWNHSLICHGEVELSTESGLRFKTYAHISPEYAGTPLSLLSRREQLDLFPGMITSLVRALSKQPHGALSADHLIVANDRSRFAIVSPGGFVVESHSSNWGPEGGEHQHILATIPENYPLLLPHGDIRLDSGFKLSEAFDYQSHLLAFDLAYQAGAIVERPGIFLGGLWGNPDVDWYRMRNRAGFARGGLLAHNVPAPKDNPTPWAADILALGIIYYRMLTEHSPFPSVFAPLWNGETLLGDVRHGVAITRLPPQSPDEMLVDASARESAIALAILDLDMERLAEVLEESIPDAR